ncbi:MAG: addiction module protein [Planctomycetes bacterium]|nr:addiction module protein [Planctomycetota bacterium]
MQLRFRRQSAVSMIDSQKAELDRRWKAYRRNPGKGSPWAVVRKRILKRS